MPRALLRHGIVAVVLTLPVAALGAAPPDPVELAEPRAGQALALGKDAVKIKPSHYLNAKKYDCTLVQGRVRWHSGPQDYPICTMTLADQAKFKSGAAEVQVRALVHGAWRSSAKTSLVLEVPPPPPPPSTGAGGEQLPPLDGIGVGTAVAASWDSQYRGGGDVKAWKQLFCPALYASLETVTASGGEVTFDVALGVTNAQGAPSKRGPEDDAHIKVTARIGANFTVTGTGTLSPATVAWVAAHPGTFPAGAKGVRFTGRMENVNTHAGTSYEQGRMIRGTVTSDTGDATCAFTSEAQDFKHTPDASWAPLLRAAQEKRGAGRICIDDQECKSNVCAKAPHGGRKCL
jgi:hypothetical protein